MKQLQTFKQDFVIKLKKLKGTPYSIACGFAFGAAISFTPFIGFHSILASMLSWITGGSIMAALIGTLVGNPWTFPIIWVAVFYSGTWLTHGHYLSQSTPNFTATLKSASEALLHLNFTNISSDIWTILYPMMIGSIPFFIIIWIFSYYTIKHLLTSTIKDKH